MAKKPVNAKKSRSKVARTAPLRSSKEHAEAVYICQSATGEVDVVTDRALGSSRIPDGLGPVFKLVESMKAGPAPAEDVVWVVAATPGTGKSLHALEVLLDRWHGVDLETIQSVPLGTAELTERMIPEAPVPTPGQAIQAQRNARARLELLGEFGALTSEQLSQRRSSPSSAAHWGR